MNSRLLFNERGNIRAEDVLPLSERVSVGFSLPNVSLGRLELYVAARKQSANIGPLMVRCGGGEVALDTSHVGRVVWLRTELTPTVSGAGSIDVEFAVQEGWSLAREAESGKPVVRLRAFASGLYDDKVTPSYGDAGIAIDRDEWLGLLPESLRTINDRWSWCWSLAGWLASSWPYANEDDGLSYAPWDARVILKWGRAGSDDNGRKPIVMCVHYAVCFVQFCIVMGVPARAVVLSPELDSAGGHFVAEVWLEEFSAWAMIDPNLHLCYRDAVTGRPFAAAELFALGSALSHAACFGEGWASQKSRLAPFAQLCLSGAVYRLWGVWRRHDWSYSKQGVPPAHGSVVYAETDIVWCADGGATKTELAMFPHFLGIRQLAAEPPAESEVGSAI